jgi:hypothetical protein
MPAWFCITYQMLTSKHQNLTLFRDKSTAVWNLGDARWPTSCDVTRYQHQNWIQYKIQPLPTKRPCNIPYGIETNFDPIPTSSTTIPICVYRPFLMIRLCTSRLYTWIHHPATGGIFQGMTIALKIISHGPSWVRRLHRQTSWYLTLMYWTQQRSYNRITNSYKGIIHTSYASMAYGGDH